MTKKATTTSRREAAVTTSAPPRRPTGAWYLVVTVLSGGMLVAWPFWHAAAKLPRPGTRRLALAATAASSFLVVLALLTHDGRGAGPAELETLNTVGFWSRVAVVVLACLALHRLRRCVYPRAARSGSPTCGPAPRKDTSSRTAARQPAGSLAAARVDVSAFAKLWSSAQQTPWNHRPLKDDVGAISEAMPPGATVSGVWRAAWSFASSSALAITSTALLVGGRSPSRHFQTSWTSAPEDFRAGPRALVVPRHVITGVELTPREIVLRTGRGVVRLPVPQGSNRSPDMEQAVRQLAT